MIWLMIPVLLLVATIVCKLLYEKYNYDLDDIAAGLFAAFIVASIVATIIVTMCTGLVIHYQTKLTEVGRDLVIAEEQYQTQVEVIQTMATRYPLEAKLFTKLNPALLLKLPEIRSNELLLAEIELALKYKDYVYKLRYKRTGLWQMLDFHSYRWFSPTLASPAYEQ